MQPEKECKKRKKKCCKTKKRGTNNGCIVLGTETQNVNSHFIKHQKIRVWTGGGGAGIVDGVNVQ